MIKQLDNYMFYTDNIIKYTKHIINYSDINDKEIKINIKQEQCEKNEKFEKNEKCENNNKNLDRNFFIPDQEDKLFWCFYILTHGFDKYEFIKNNSFKFEKDFKIKTIENIRNQKDLLKAYKIKKNIIENELLNENKISIKTLNLLALINKQNFIFISGRTYLLINYSVTEKIQDSTNIIIQNGYKYKIYNENIRDYEKETIKKNIDFIINNYWQIEDINKFIRAISAYTVSELTEIAKKLDVSIITELNKKKTKKELYDEILLKLNN